MASWFVFPSLAQFASRMVGVNEPKIKIGQVLDDDEDDDDDDYYSEQVSAYLPPAPDGGWGWVVTFGSFMIHVITDGLTYSFGLFYEEFLLEFKEGKGTTAWILSILVGVTLCSGPIASAFVNRYGCRTVTIIGAILASICLSISIYAPSITFLYGSIGFGTGLGFGLIYLPAIVSVTMYFEKYRSLATGIAVCGSGFGTFLLAPLLEYLIDQYGWRGALLVTAGIVCNCVIFGATFRPLEAAKPEISVENTFIEIEQNGGKRSKATKQLEPAIAVTVTTPGSIKRPHSIAQFEIPIKTIDNMKTYDPVDGNQNEIYRMALSHPMLMTEHSKQMYNHHRRTGPLYKPDIFYQGSLMNLPQYKSKLDDKIIDTSSELIRKSHVSLRSKQLKLKSINRATMCGCIECSQETKDTLIEMLDLSLLKDPVFLLFTFSNFCTSIGFNVPFVYTVSRANLSEAVQNSTMKASTLLSVIGIANTIGRIVLGYFSDKPNVNRLLVYNMSLVICGLATILSAFCYDFLTYSIYCSIFGFTIGAYVGLTSVILVDLLGLEKLTNAFGLLLLFQGIASFLGPPIAGWLYDIFESYNPGFYTAGVSILISGLILFFIPSIQRWQKNVQNTSSLKPVFTDD